MTGNSQVPNRTRSDIPPRHGFTESHSENMLRDSILLAAALTETLAILILQDDIGTWYRDSSGLTSEQLADIEPALSHGPTDESGTSILLDHGLQIIEMLPLVDIYHRVIGTLSVLSKVPITLSVSQREGLKLLADHIQTIVTIDHQKLETRNIPRAPAAASFVPGLVHELGSFIFGISANLDAFEARFADMDEVTKYGANIRKSLDRMSAFIQELKEYGDPHLLSWSTHDLGLLLKEAIEHLGPSAARKSIQLLLDINGALSPVNADDQSLLSAFVNVIDMVLEREETGGDLVIHASTNRQGDRDMICGHLDCSSLKFKDIDPSRLFEPFYFRVSGLGRLALPGARRVFEAHGGTLTAGPGPGGGMRISFMVPAVLTYPLRSAGQP